MPSAKSQSRGSRARSGSSSSTRSGTSGASRNAGDSSSGLAEQLLTRIIKPLGLVVLTTDRIQEILDDAAARGRVTRSDANELVVQLVNRGRQQTDQLVSDIERLLGRRREQLPILGYDELTAAQVQSRLVGRSPAELRKVRDYERRHANRKSVLAAIDKHLRSG